VSVKIRLADFSTYTRAVTLDRPTNYVEDLYRHALAKVRGFSRGRQALRLLGIHVSNLEREADQLDLFQADEGGGKKREKLHEAVDTIKDRFGEGAIKHRK
jgi:DNA polymerase-4